MTWGAEALIRWQDPGGELILPGMFIPLAEEMGLSEAIGDWVLQEVCDQAAEWRGRGFDIITTYNLSTRQLLRKNLVQRVVSSVSSAGIDPSRIVIEITESTAMHDPDHTQQILWDLHDNGIRLAIDDFGSGYSSFSRLKHLPVDILKIDRSFVRDLPDDHDARTICTAIVKLAANLGLVSLAEGIETTAQRQFLIELGCGLGQGYLFSRAVPAEEITSLLESPVAASG
jgi:EAL domain-containing protein (putative c-di-GMP-specific phosphodiesterase class I)